MLSNRPFARVLAAQGLSSLGTSVSTVALAVMVFDLTGSVLHMGGVLAAATFPLVVMTFFGGALLDRFEARRLMVVADVARAAMMLMMPLAASRSVGFIYVVAAAVGVFSALFNPSQVKLIGELVPADGLVKANSYLSIAREGAELGGYLVGGALVVVLGYTVTFIADAASYLISATFLFALPASVVRLTGKSLGSAVSGITAGGGRHLGIARPQNQSVVGSCSHARHHHGYSQRIWLGAERVRKGSHGFCPHGGCDVVRLDSGGGCSQST